MNLEIIEIIKNYITNDGTGATPISIIKFSIEALICLGIIVFLIIFFLNHVKSGKIRFMIFLTLIAFILSYLFNLHYAFIMCSILLIIYTILIISMAAPEYKGAFGSSLLFKKEKNYIKTEESRKELVDTLIKTCAYLSSRKIGAIITIEKENTLNTYIDKATKIESIVSFELLATIFFPNTALHDGAVIIRGNQIMCAGAFYPSSETADLPKQLGSRHRAGLGISEVSDSFTIVVSEETGNLSTMMYGTLNNNITIEKLRDSLTQNILVKNK